MQVILLKDIDRLGNAGEVIRVKDGYATNFLIPRNLAKRLTRKGIKFLEDEKRKVSLRQNKLKAKAEVLKDKLAATSCTIAMTTGDDERLHGTITAEMIKEAYAKEGIEIDKKEIQLKEHINRLGVYNVDIRLHPEVIATVKLWVVKR